MSAEIDSISSCVHSEIWLQWGRARMSAEMYDVASPQEKQSLASMGPRSDERGNGAKPQTARAVLPLQWGRARMSAEMTKQR